MDINLKVKQGLRIRAFYLFFIMSGIQIGVGVMGTPKYIFLDAQQDSWISVLMAYAAMLIVLWVMLLILKSYDNADILGIQVDIFGTWIGKLLGTVYMLYFAFVLLVVLVTYIDVVQLFIFPQINTWLLGFLLLSLVVYCVAGGLRSIVGVVFLFFILSHWLLLLLAKPISLIDISNYQPVWQASMIDLLKGAKSTTFTFTGFEIIFWIYPFIRNKNQVWRPIFLGATWSAGIILLNTLIVIGYFSATQARTIEWSVLSLFKIVELPFIARFDFIVVAEWMMITLPTMMLLMWAITQGMKRLYHVPKRITLYAAALIFLVVCGFIDEHHLIMALNNQANSIAFWIIFVYPLALLPIVKLKKAWQSRSKKGAKR
ncbi:germination protein GerB [Lentibacillus kapialis]|uniref:Germination protein GerB n=1 Tax=Lentibacillus kapialis TaxID=340214 RepID=A0A917V176_9BACI|nr:GerAB/ArcD/ProY family transporter [Lentibacillus kapialis]GGK08359.1 germination protein GerB [Lentibacillus kapialis]